MIQGRSRNDRIEREMYLMDRINIINKIRIKKFRLNVRQDVRILVLCMIVVIDIHIKESCIVPYSNRVAQCTSFHFQ